MFRMFRSRLVFARFGPIAETIAAQEFVFWAVLSSSLLGFSAGYFRLLGLVPISPLIISFSRLINSLK